MTLTQNDRLVTNINTLIGHLAYARSEALKRSQQVSLCVSNNTTGCTGGSWKDGWIVYIDADGNNSHSAGEEILRVNQAWDATNIVTTTFGNQITYDYRGFASTGAGGSLLLCDGRSGDFGKTINISATGRVRFQGGSTC
jgi:type IV fimbrial biogenesis protein FimT